MKVWTYLAIAAGMAAIVLTFGAARDAQRRCDSMRLAAVDRKLQLIMDHLGIAEPDQYLPKVIAHLAQGRKSSRRRRLAIVGLAGSRRRCADGTVIRLAQDVERVRQPAPLTMTLPKPEAHFRSSYRF